MLVSTTAAQTQGLAVICTLSVVGAFLNQAWEDDLDLGPIYPNSGREGSEKRFDFLPITL